MKNMRMEVFGLTKISSKGQIVIPSNVRKKMQIEDGTFFAVSAKENMLILKKLDTKMKEEDLKTLKLLEEAWEDIAKGRYKVYSTKAFFKELKKW